MRKSNVISIALMVVFTLFMVSCNSDDRIECPDELVGELSDAEKQFSGTWIFTGMDSEVAIDLTNDETNNPEKDIFAQYTQCDRDLVYDFNDNRSYSLKQGHAAAIDCDNKQSLTGTWSLTSGNVLTFVANCATQSIGVTFDDTGNSFSFSNVLNFVDVNNTQITSKVTFTYTKAAEAATTATDISAL